MDYRKYYESQTGQKIPKGFHIHHIDFNRENNRMDNLVAIPNKLHLKYHSIQNKCSKIISYLNNQRGFFFKGVEIKYFNDFIKIREQVFDYELIRDGQCEQNGNPVLYSGNGCNNFFIK